MSGSRFMGASLLSTIASLVFVAFFALGLMLLFSDVPSNGTDLLPGVAAGIVRAFGGAFALFGMCGLLIARGLAVLVAIERSLSAALNSAETADGGPEGSSTAFKVGQLIGKAVHGGK